MTTKLRIKSNYEDDDSNINQLLKDFTDNITECESTIEYVVDDVYNTKCPVFIVEYSDCKQLKAAITKFNDYRYKNLEDVDDETDIMSSDFTISLESENINDAFSHLTHKNMKYIEDQVNMLDYISSDIVNEQEDLKEKVDALYAFMQKSGILYYKQMVEGLLEVMDQQGLVDKDKLQSTMFKNVH